MSFITLKQPAFWKKRYVSSYALIPFSYFYIVVCKIYNLLFSRWFKLSVPVICIGNVTVGGSGKTPACIAIASALKSHGLKVGIISRGYKSYFTRTKGVMRVLADSDPDIVGDEPLLLAQVAPTFISVNKVDAAIVAQNYGCQILLMDDGLQSTSIQSDYKIMLIDSIDPFGNGYVMPAGPLREPLHNALNRADDIIVIGRKNDKNNIISKYHLQHYAHKIHNIELIMENYDEISNKKYIGVCGIAKPEKFLQSAKKANCILEKYIELPNHWSASSVKVEDIIEIAKRHNLKILTTSKDAIKFPQRFAEYITILKIKLAIPQWLIQKCIAINC